MDVDSIIFLNPTHSRYLSGSSSTTNLSSSICQKYNFVLNDMIKLNSECMKEDLGVGIAFYVISSPVQFFYNRLLLTDIGKTVQPVRKIFFIIRQVNIAPHDL